MTSGPVVVQVLEGENAIAKNREVMGATNPAKAAAGTIRKEFATIDRRELRARLRRAGDREAARSRSSSGQRDRRLSGQRPSAVVMLGLDPT